MSRHDYALLPHMTEIVGLRNWPMGAALRERVRIYETHATISESDWQALPRYESSFPSGVYAGKAWRRGAYLCWYGRPRKVTEYGREKEICSIGYARALIQGPGTNLTYRQKEQP